MVQDNIPPAAAAAPSQWDTADELATIWAAYTPVSELATQAENAYKIAYLASVFNSGNLTNAKKALVFNEAGLTAANSAAIFNEAGLTAANSAAIFNEAGLTAANSAAIFNEAGLTAANSAAIFNEAGLTAANSAAIFNEAGLTAANSAAIFNEAGLTAANSAAIFNEAGLTAANSALIFREAGLSIANINAIIIHANITDDNAQQILSEITKANRDLTSATNIYEILDDWDDNKLTGRDGAGTTSTGFTNLFAQKDLFRPDWTVVTGTWNAAAGYMVKTATNTTNEYIYTPSTFVVGTWEFDYTRSNVGDHAMFFIMNSETSITATADGYAIRVGSGNIFNLRKQVNDSGSTIIASTDDNDTNPHTAKATRDASGNFEIFSDAVSKGTTTDNTVTTSVYIVVLAYHINFRFDNLKVY